MASSFGSFTLIPVAPRSVKMKFLPRTRKVGSPSHASMSTRTASGSRATMASRRSMFPMSRSCRNRVGMGRMEPVVRNAVDRSRYELIVDEQVVGIADYRVIDDEVVFPHTEILSHLRGRGLGEILVRGAVEDVKATGRT